MSIKWNNVKQTGQSIVRKPKTIISDTGIGPSEFIAGDANAGFFGEVTASELFTGPELASAIGLSLGNAQNDNEPWLKFAFNGNILYVAKKPYRYGLSWDDIANVDAVYGGENDAQVTKSGYSLRVRLLKGAGNDSTDWVYDSEAANSTSGSNYDPPEAIGSEWNELIYRIHQDNPTNQEGSNWVSYTDADITDRIVWCQETYGTDTSQRVCRGNSFIESFSAHPSDDTSPSGWGGGWRPCLVLIN